MRVGRLFVSFVALLAPIAVSPLPARAAATGPGGQIAFSYGVQQPGDDLGAHSDVWTVRPDGSGLHQLTHVPADKVAALPSISTQGTRIAYQSNVSGENQIWAMDADGRHQIQVTHDTGFDDLSPSWSPNGRRIVFSRCDKPFGSLSSCDIAVVDANGGRLQTIVHDHRIHLRPRFSPDGRKIVFASDRGGLLSAIWVVNADGRGLRRLTRANKEGFWPDWSPDGRHILFSDNCCRPQSNLWTVRPNGTGLARLTDATPDLNAAFGSYSPTGRQIVYFNDHDLIVRNAHGQERSIISNAVPILATWGRSVDGPRAAVRPPLDMSSAGPTATAATISLDAATPGSKAVGSRRDGRIAFRDFSTGQIYAANPDGTAVVALTHLDAAHQARQPEWSPNGRQVAYALVRANTPDDNARIWIVNADGNGSRMLADDSPGYRDYQPRFTPDGRHVVFSRCLPDNGVCAIWIMRADGSHKRALTPFRTGANEAIDFGLDVSPDGRHVAFARFEWHGVAAQIFEIRIDGTHEHPVSAPRVEGSRPAYSPNGRRITVSGETTHLGGHIYALRPNGTQVRALTHTAYPFYDLGSVYAPGGDRIAFSSDRRHADDCCLDLYIMNSDGSGVRRVPVTGHPGIIDVAWGTAPLAPASTTPANATPATASTSSVRIDATLRSPNLGRAHRSTAHR